MFFFDQQLPPCGIGGESVSHGPCSGTYSASQAGQDAFAAVSAQPVVKGLLVAAVIFAAVLFALWAVRAVGKFFNGRSSGAAVAVESDEDFWARHGRAFGADAEFSEKSSGDLDFESDREDDVEDDSPLELGHESREDNQ